MPHRPEAARLQRVGATLVLALLAALAAQALHVPLPWMIGPLLAIAALGLGYVFYRFLHRVNGGDRATTFFAAATVGASERAVLAVSAAGMALLARLRVPNPWVLGALRRFRAPYLDVIGPFCPGSTWAYGGACPCALGHTESA